MAKITLVCPICQNHFIPRTNEQRTCSITCGHVVRAAERTKDVGARFWSKVKKTGPNDCWLWQGRCNRAGYGTFTDEKGNERLAHRIARMLLIGPIPDGLCVCHNCPGGDNPKCVNPAHTFLGTKADNIADMDRKGRRGIAPGKRGMDYAAAKLTESKVLEIRARYASGGITQKKLAELFQVTQSNIRSIVIRKTWAHI